MLTSTTLCGIIRNKKGLNMALITEEEMLHRLHTVLGAEYEILSNTMSEGDNYSKAKAKVKHLVCGNEYSVSTTNVFKHKRKCPFCSITHRIDEKEAVKRIKNRYGDEYTFLENYKGYSIAINMKHNCGHNLHVSPMSLINGNNCKDCLYKSDHTTPGTFKKELWLPYKDTGYIVSNTGIVKNKKGLILRPYLRKSGYYYYKLYINGRNIGVGRYRLVAEVFIPNPENLTMVNHIDETHYNDRVDNLQWCTPRYNSNYGTLISRKTGVKRKGTGTPVYAIFKDGTDRYFESAVLAENYFGKPVTTAHISNVIKGNQKTTGGLMFEKA